MSGIALIQEPVTTTGVQSQESETDPDLVDAVRSGDLAAFSRLYQRHRALAGYVARAECDNRSDADDVVADAFASVLDSLVAGHGPRDSFQAYLTTAVRRLAYRRNVKSRRAPVLGYGSAMDALILDDDQGIMALESTVLMKAFQALPLRWRAVLWCVEVEGLKPAATARVMELTPNGVSSLLIRAREGLRQAYLQEHVPPPISGACTDISKYLGKFVRNAVRQAAKARVDQHLAACTRCTEALVELRELQSVMPGRSATA